MQWGNNVIKTVSCKYVWYLYKWSQIFCTDLQTYGDMHFTIIKMFVWFQCLSVDASAKM